MKKLLDKKTIIALLFIVTPIIIGYVMIFKWLWQLLCFLYDIIINLF